MAALRTQACSVHVQDEPERMQMADRAEPWSLISRVFCVCDPDPQIFFYAHDHMRQVHFPI